MATLAGQYGPVGYEYPNGQHAANVPYRVTNSSNTNIILYADKNKSVTKPNPGSTTDELGNISFYASPGEYLLLVNEGTPLAISVPLHPEEPLSGGGGSGGPVSYRHIQGSTLNTITVTTGLDFNPAGIVAIDNSGNPVEYNKVSYPDTGVVELEYLGGGFSGTIYLS